MNNSVYECIDFDRRFSVFLNNWLEKKRHIYKGNMDKVEELVPEIYEEFLNTPLEEDAAVIPLSYFSRYDDAAFLIGWMQAYRKAGISIPDMLMERIVELGEPAEKELYRLVCAEEASEEMRMTAASLLQELDSTLPLTFYADAVAAAQTDSGLIELFTESLIHMGKEATIAARDRYYQATGTGKMDFLDILSRAVEKGDTYELIVEQLKAGNERIGLLVSYLARLNEERALPLLYNLCKKPDIGYLDYIEVVNAIDTLGGEAPAEREFSGDPAYESLRQL